MAHVEPEKQCFHRQRMEERRPHVHVVTINTGVQYSLLFTLLTQHNAQLPQLTSLYTVETSYPQLYKYIAFIETGHDFNSAYQKY